MSSRSKGLTLVQRLLQGVSSSMSTSTYPSQAFGTAFERVASSFRTSTSSFRSAWMVSSSPLHTSSLAHQQRHVSPLQSMKPAVPSSPTAVPRPLYDLTPRELEGVFIEKPLWAEARWRRAPTSAKKLRIPVNLVRRMHVTDALLQLQLVRKKSARILSRVIWRARSNAVHNHGMDPDKLVISQVSASVGPNREREVDYKSKARYGIIVRGRAHIFVRLQEVEGARPFTKIKMPKLWRERLDRERTAAQLVQNFA